MRKPTLRIAIGAWLLAFVLPLAGAQGSDDVIVQARESLRKKDRAALAAARAAVNATRHPLAMWVEYWELGNRLAEAQQPELDAFYARWPGSYVEDRLRNDWLLELGRRRDWANVRVEYPRFRMNDDREVSCYALLAQHLAGQDVRAAARSAWLAQRDLDDGCALLSRTLVDAKVLGPADAWDVVRQSVELNRPRAARAAAALISPATAQAVTEIFENPVRWLARKPHPTAARGAELELIALMRNAATDPDYTAQQLDGPWADRLAPGATATAWAHVAKQSALKQSPLAVDYARRAWTMWDGAYRKGEQPPWSDELLAWHVRAALRQPARESRRWTLVQRAVTAMSPNEQRDDAWVYWNARAVQALAPAGAPGDTARATAAEALKELAREASFYGALATEDLGGQVALPPPPAALTREEIDTSRAQAGLGRALRLIDIGLRSEGVREWNFTLRGMDDRALRAAAQWACEREVWDRCINTSERARGEFDLAQRFPVPFRDAILGKSRSVGIDPAVVYGLIRQESRFIGDARSHVGASGLMQLMPATAKWTAKKIGMDYRPEMINDREVNLHLGAAYLKRVLDDFDGSLALAAAAYNAGPGRSRRWREGPVVEPAAWAESIPFNETRDYVKKVLFNSVYYGALLGPGRPTLKSRLGPPIGPPTPGSSPPDRDIP